MNFNLLKTIEDMNFENVNKYFFKIQFEPHNNNSFKAYFFWVLEETNQGEGFTIYEEMSIEEILEFKKYMYELKQENLLKQMGPYFEYIPANTPIFWFKFKLSK